MNLQWIREHDKDRDGQLSNSDEDRSGRVHCDNVSSNLPRCEICLRLESTWTDLRTESKVAKHPNNLVNPNSRADRCAYDDVHAALRIVDQFIVDREELRNKA